MQTSNLHLRFEKNINIIWMMIPERKHRRHRRRIFGDTTGSPACPAAPSCSLS
jgi:hypothetical protein